MSHMVISVSVANPKMIASKNKYRTPQTILSLLQHDSGKQHSLSSESESDRLFRYSFAAWASCILPEFI
jgi:hypothetical protein